MQHWLLLVFTSLAVHAQPAASGKDSICLGQGDPKNDFYMKDLDSKIARVNDIEKQISEKQSFINANTQKFLNQKSADAVNLQKAKDEYENRKMRNDETIGRLKIDLDTKALEYSYGHGEKEQGVGHSNAILDLERQTEELHQKYLKAQKPFGNLQGANQDLENQIADLQKQKEKLRFVADWLKDQKFEDGEDDSGYCTDCVLLDPMRAIGGASHTIEKLGRFMQAVIVPHLDKSCVQKSMAAKSAGSDEFLCSDSKSLGRVAKNSGGQCLSEKLSNFIAWNFNKAIDCLSTAGSPVDPNVLFRKVNNESTFRPYYSYNGGQGVMQTTQASQDEMLGLAGGRTLGRKFLARLMHNHGDKCAPFKSIMNYDKEYEIDSQDDLVKNLKDISHLKPDDIKDLQDRYSSQLRIYETQNPEIYKAYTQLDDVKRVYDKLVSENKLSGQTKNDYEKAMGGYQSNLDALRKNPENNNILDKVRDLRNMVLALKHANNMDAGDKQSLNKIADQEKAKSDKLKSDYPPYSQRLFNSDKSHACQFISLDEGMQRNIINGIGLFLYYRDGYYGGSQDDGSARWLMKNDFQVKSPSNAVLNAVALPMYGPDGSGGATTKLKANKWQLPQPNSMDSKKLDQTMANIFPYVKSANNSEQQVKDHFNEDNLLCTVQPKP